MEDIGRILGYISFVLLGVWRVYWFVTGQRADREKPRSSESSAFFSKRNLSKIIVLAAFGVVGVQLLGVSLFEMPIKSLWQQVLGFLLVVIGLGIAVIGRYNLGTNWANCYEYQVKPKQELVTKGIYAYIRHPLYAGISLFLIGSELVVQSYLFYVYCFVFLGANQQAKWEEELLLRKFGDTYKSYMKRTKRFIPFLW